MFKKFFTLFLILAILSPFFFFPKPVSAGIISRPPTNLGLIGYWSLDEGSGTKAGDSSGNGNNLTLVGTSWVNGKYSKALNFSSSLASTSKNTSLNISGGNLTMSAWFKANSFSGIKMLVTKGAYGCHWNYGMGFSGNSLLARFDNGDVISSAVTTQIGQWNNLTIVYSGLNVLYYYNGVLVDTKSNNGWSAQTGNQGFTLGVAYSCSGGFSEYFDGSMDDVRVYNRLLSASEISNLYKSSQATRKQVSNSGLIGYWSMNEGSGTKVTDSSGRGNTGTITGAAWTSGKRGGALNFNGVDNYVDIDLRNSGLTKSQTLSAWVKPNGPPSGKPHQTVVSTDPDYRSGVKLMSYKNFAQVGLWLGTGSSSYQAMISTDINDSKWHFISGVYDYDAGTVQIFIDGVMSSPINTGQMLINLSSIGKIGRDYHNTDYSYSGSIDDVRVYNRALSVTEIQNLYNQTEVKVNSSQNNKLTNGLVGLWSFDGADISGTTAYDRSGNGNNGTISGATKTMGKIGQALSFGSSKYITFPNISLANMPYTVTAWVYKNDINDLSIVGGGVGGTNGSAHYIIRGSKAFFGNYSCDLGGVTNINQNQWYHIVFVMDINQKKSIYVNGVLDSGPVLGCGYYQSYVNLIGSSCCGGAGNGTLDDVRIYNRDLSADEIKKLYNMGH